MDQAFYIIFLTHAFTSATCHDDQISRFSHRYTYLGHTKSHQELLWTIRSHMMLSGAAVMPPGAAWCRQQKVQDHSATGSQGKVRVTSRPVSVLNFLYPTIRVRTAPSVSFRVRVRVKASISLLYRLYAWCWLWPCAALYLMQWPAARTPLWSSHFVHCLVLFPVRTHGT